MTFIDSAYHYYLSVYGNSATSRYDTHKKSELRNVCNNIRKVNKESPLYKIQNNRSVPRFLIDIKENARKVQNVVASLSDHGEGLENAFQKKVAVSSDEDIVSASYIGGAGDDSQQFDIEVRRMAEPQTNFGNFLEGRGLDFEPGDYAFDLVTTINSYEFQFTVNPDDTNRSVQEKLSRLVNSSGVGLTAEVVTDEKDRSALKLTSKQTGLSENRDSLFDINPKASGNSIEAMELLGIHEITTPAQNASFILNGTEHSSYSNTFTVNNAFELQLNGISPEDKPSRIGFKTSVDAVADNLQELVSAYNGFIETGERYTDSPQGGRLLGDLRAVSYSYRSDLESIGMLVKDNGAISIDKGILEEAVDTNDIKGTFSVLDAFKNSLAARASRASIDPIKYVDKIIVAYKKPGQNFPSPYQTSLYSGMMLDRYC